MFPIGIFLSSWCYFRLVKRKIRSHTYWLYL